MVKTISLIAAAATILSSVKAAPTNTSYKRLSAFENIDDSYVCSFDDNASFRVIDI